MRVRTILCAVVMSIGLTSAAAADEGLTLEVGDQISLKAENLFLRKVLVELSETVPFKLVERGETLDQPVSFDFEASSWEDAIGVLLRGEGYALTTDAATGQPEMLVIDWDVVGEALAAAPAGDQALADQLKAALPEVQAGQQAAQASVAELKAALTEALAGQQAAEASAAEAAARSQELAATRKEMRQEIESLAATADSAKAAAAWLREELAAARRESEQLTANLAKAQVGQRVAEASVAELEAALTEARAGWQAAEASAAEAAALNQELAATRGEMQQEIKRLSAMIVRDTDTLLDSLDRNVAALGFKNRALEEKLAMVSLERDLRSENLTAGYNRRADPAEGRDQAKHIVGLQSAKATEGDYAVHLASYKSVERARAGWTTLQRDFPALLSDKTLAMQRVELGDRGIYHRLLAAHFNSRAQAQTFCAELKAKMQYCRVMKH